MQLLLHLLAKQNIPILNAQHQQNKKQNKQNKQNKTKQNNADVGYSIYALFFFSHGRRKKDIIRDGDYFFYDVNFLLF